MHSVMHIVKSPIIKDITNDGDFAKICETGIEFIGKENYAYLRFDWEDWDRFLSLVQQGREEIV